MVGPKSTQTRVVGIIMDERHPYILLSSNRVSMKNVQGCFSSVYSLALPSLQWNLYYGHPWDHKIYPDYRGVLISDFDLYTSLYYVAGSRNGVLIREIHVPILDFLYGEIPIIMLAEDVLFTSGTYHNSFTITMH